MLRSCLAMLVLSGTAVLAREGTGPAAQPESSPSWGMNPIWDDGLAEVATYEAGRTVYGKVRRFETVLITVKEDFNETSHVKADPPYEGKRLLPILKLNVASTIVTENYPYHYLTSVFVRRDDVFRLVKLTNGSQEWCGNTFKLIGTWGDRPEFIFHSYWDGQGDGSYPLEWGKADLAEDQLPIALRGLPFEVGYRRGCRLIDTQISNQAGVPKPRDAEIRVVAEETVPSGAGRVPCWRVEVSRSGSTQRYWIEKAFPNILVKFESPDGRSLSLRGRERRMYW